MKILQVTNFFKPLWEAGGVARISYELSRGLLSKNHQVTVYTTNKFINKVKSIENVFVIEENIQIYYFKNFLHYTPTIPLPLLSIFTIRKEVKKFDIIHIHEHRSLLAVLVCYYARKYQIPYIIQAHGSVLPFFDRQNLKKLYDFVWGYNILRNASKLIALTDTEADQYCTMGIPKNKIEIIPNGLDLTQFSHLPTKGDFRSKYGISIKDKMILFLGRIHKIKGIDVLITAYSELLKEFPDVQLVIVGPDDNYLSIIEEQIKQLKISKKPIFTGTLSGYEKLSAFVDADVYVLPSHYETFSIALLEAMLCGTPVIITNDIKHFDWIHNKTGFISKNDAEDLKKYLWIILNDEKLRQSFGENGKNIVNEYFDFNHILQKIINLYIKSIKTK